MNTTGKITLAALAATAWLALGPAMADEVTHTETTTTHSEPTLGTVITAPARAAGAAVDAVVGGPPDCSKTKVTKTDEDTGDTVTKTKTSCD